MSEFALICGNGKASVAHQVGRRRAACPEPRPPHFVSVFPWKANVAGYGGFLPGPWKGSVAEVAWANSFPPGNSFRLQGRLAGPVKRDESRAGRRGENPSSHGGLGELHCIRQPLRQGGRQNRQRYTRCTTLLITAYQRKRATTFGLATSAPRFPTNAWASPCPAFAKPTFFIRPSHALPTPVGITRSRTLCSALTRATPHLNPSTLIHFQSSTS